MATKISTPKTPSLKGYTYINTGKNGLIRKGSGVNYKTAKQYGSFSYDPLADASYQSLAKIYNANGIRAANDTLGASAALNGGYGSSYAVSAAQQARNDYNQQLAAMVPELEQNAYTRWNNDREYDFNVAQARDNQWYQKMGLWMDAISSNNNAAASTNSDRLAKANFGLDKAGFKLDLAQFNWQKKKAKSSGGGGGGRRGRRGGGGGGGYYGGYGNSSSGGNNGITGNASGNYMVFDKGKYIGDSSTYKGNVAVDKKGVPTKKKGTSVKGGAKGSQGYNAKTKTGSYRRGNKEANQGKKKKK